MRLIIAVALLLALPGTLFADLLPAEVGVVAMKNSPQSIEVAEYYVKARGIPRKHICLIEATAGETLSRAEWESKVRPAIRKWVIDNQLETKLRCLVTVWDVPLKIDKSKDPDGMNQSREVYLKGEQTNRMFRLRTLIERLNSLLPGEKGPRPLPKKDANAQTLIDDFQAAFKDARNRINPVRETPEGRKANLTIGKTFITGGGMVNMVRNFQSQLEQKKDNPQLEKLMATTAGQIAGLNDGRTALSRLPDSVERDEAVLSLVERSDGLLGSLAWIDAELQMLEKNESYSSFDSELSLLYWPSYSLGRWATNVLHYRFDNSYTRQVRTTLMVSRLEAPTLDLTKKLIDTAIAVEKVGLDGKFYIDTRGLAQPGEKITRGTVKEYDAQLLNLASVAEKFASLPVVLDTNEELFQPGDGPLAALYCGWYSLANYIDAFEWKPGAVGYHIASSEAETLRKPTSNVWCKKMLENGVCATLGPVYEPYLTAFPPPNEFFLLLLSGKRTLVECYYRTKPYNSWVMVLVGDPLYNPFKVNPQFEGKEIPVGLQQLIDGQAIVEP